VLAPQHTHLMPEGYELKFQGGSATKAEGQDTLSRLRMGKLVEVRLIPPGLALLHSNEFNPTIVRLHLHSTGLFPHFLNLAHIPVVHAGHLPIVPGDRDRIPTRFGDNSAICGLSSPINADAFLEVLGFGGCHCASPIDGACTMTVRMADAVLEILQRVGISRVWYLLVCGISVVGHNAR
jgi:hypothetical protein